MAMRPVSEVLSEQARRSDDTVELGSLLGSLQSRAHGAALLVFALPEALPIPTPSVSTILAVPLIIVSTHLLLFGDEADLPSRISRIRVPMRVVRAAIGAALPALRWAERWSRPRWPAIAGRVWLAGGAALVLSVILLLPIPLFNLAPAFSLAVIGFGLIQRDGLVIVLGIGLAVALIALMIWLAGSLAAFLAGG
jgi:hypothetical protein